MNKFLWIVPLRNTEDFLMLFPSYRGREKDVFLMRDFVLKQDPVKYLKIDAVRSAKGFEIEGYVFVCPLFPDQIVMEKENLLKKMRKLMDISNGLGIKFIGLGGLIGDFAEDIEPLARAEQIVVTSGKNYTAAIVAEGIKKALESKGGARGKRNLSIIGVNTLLGKVCFDILKSDFKNILLESETNEILRNSRKDDFEVVKSWDQALQLSDVVLIASNSPLIQVSIDKLKKRSIVCDAIPPFKKASEIIASRNDIFVFEGTRVINEAFTHNWTSDQYRVFFKNDSIYSCISETMVLAFENIEESFSVDEKNINQERSKLIYKLAVDNGFKISGLWSGSKIFNKSDLKRVFRK